MAKNRRRHPRIPVTVRVDGADRTGRSWMELAHDLSRGGLRLAYSIPATVGDTVTVTFQLPTDQPCKLPARVIRTDATGSALEFLHDLPPELVPYVRTDEISPALEKDRFPVSIETGRKSP